MSLVGLGGRRVGGGWGLYMKKIIYKIFKILLYNIGQGQWVSLVGLGEGRGVGGGWVGSVYEKINI